MTRTLAIASALLALLLAAHGGAQETAEGEPDSWAYGYFNDVMSPFCPGRTLSACTSPQAESLRMWILVQAAAGRTQEDVNSELVERYGDVILSAPRAEGFGVTAYAIPVAFFLGGGLLVGIFLRRHTRTSEAPAVNAPHPAPEPLDPEIERIIDEELAR